MIDFDFYKASPDGLSKNFAGLSVLRAARLSQILLHALFRIIPSIDKLRGRVYFAREMSRVVKNKLSGNLNERLTTGGFRFTPQREHVYNVLLEKRDHPTAEEVFLRAKHRMPDISMATVYNCLDALVKCGLARQVQIDRGATRFCPNMCEHGHFYCDS